MRGFCEERDLGQRFLLWGDAEPLEMFWGEKVRRNFTAEFRFRRKTPQKQWSKRAKIALGRD
jgi:hypothetical protein